MRLLLKKLFLIIALFVSEHGMSQANVADARTYSIGQTVTVTAVATNGAELGQIRYVQDSSAAIACYGSQIANVLHGDSITITGEISEFAGLLEIAPIASVVNHGQALVQPSSLSVPISLVGETYEAQLLTLENVTFVQTGSFAGNTNYEITDGSQSMDIRVGSGTNIVGTPIPTDPVNVTGVLGQYNASYQLLPRGTDDFEAYAPPGKEINVKIDGNNIPNQGEYFFGNSNAFVLRIENQGTDSLELISLGFTGVNANEFTSNFAAGMLAGTSFVDLNVAFNPTTSGTQVAQIELSSNDDDEGLYEISLEGVGTDNLSSEPQSNPQQLSFPTNKSYQSVGEFDAVADASSYLVLWSKDAVPNQVPVDGTTYQRGDVLGNAAVAYIGAFTNFSPRAIRANSTYYFAVYALNGQDGFENYQTLMPLTQSIQTPGQNIGLYYDGISSASTNLTNDLEALIRPHTEWSYFLYRENMMKNFEIRDTVTGQSVVTCALSGENLVFNDPFDWGATGYSREHTFAHSWMPSWPANNPEKAEYNDYHNLYPANLDKANSPRSNMPLGEIDGTVTYSYLNGKIGYMGNQLVYEPRDEHKGNTARAIMYMVVAYDFDLLGDPDSDNQTQAILKKWHFEDLPDNYEIARHEYIFDLQGNRNPFIDSIDFACWVNFETNAFQTEGCELQVEEYLQTNLVVFPVPSADKVFVQVNGTTLSQIDVYDLQGRLVKQENLDDIHVWELNASDFPRGNYFIQVTTPYGVAQKYMVFE